MLDEAIHCPVKWCFAGVEIRHGNVAVAQLFKLARCQISVGIRTVFKKEPNDFEISAESSYTER